MGSVSEGAPGAPGHLESVAASPPPDVDRMSYEELLELTDRVGSVSRGLSAATVARLPKHRYVEDATTTESPTCSICLDDFSTGHELVSLPCMHRFHASCICEWLQKATTCPCCTQDVGRGYE